MKRIIPIISVLSFFLLSCGRTDRTVFVANPYETDRMAETVEVPCSQLGIRGLSSETAVVKSETGENLPCQIVSDAAGRETLIFQVDLKKGEQKEYVVLKGRAVPCDTLVNSRYVPEREDDYAYENNLVIGRIYGPALESPRTFGQDIWIKNTSRFVLDDWLKGRDFHRNHGEGMDVYMVGAALGGGACAPVNEGKICIGDNWKTQRRLCNGPVRTSAEFTCPEFSVNGVSVKTERSLSLDANSRFVRWTCSFDAQGADSLDVVVGAAVHEIVCMQKADNYIAFTEWASDSRLADPKQDGKISIGLVVSERFKATPDIMDGHAVLKFRVASGEVIEYWTGSGWDQGGIESPESWNDQVKDFAYSLNHPLTVKVK